MIRQTVHYSGHVQGVGFRHTTSHLARDFAVTGYVRNLADGRVELVAEGERQEVGRFLAKLADHLASNIRSADQHESPATGKYAVFAIAK